MALTQQQRNDNTERKRIKFDEKALRHRVRPGIHQAMERICERSKGMQINEVLQMAILKMDAMPDDELNKFLMVRHEILLSENVVQAFNDASARKILSDPDQEADDEIERPAALPRAALQRLPLFNDNASPARINHEPNRPAGLARRKATACEGLARAVA